MTKAMFYGNNMRVKPQVEATCQAHYKSTVILSSSKCKDKCACSSKLNKILRTTYF